MPFTRSLVVSALLAIVFTGCKKADAPPAPTTGDSVTAPAASTAGGSVAAPASSLPPSDATLPAAPAVTSSSGNAAGPAQTDPKELTKQQESTDMPLSGQANNHSTTNPVEKNK
jgi:hypothetical protein